MSDNHNFEFEPNAGGKCVYDIFTEEFSSDMKFEIDVFWVKAIGVDPVTLGLSPRIVTFTLGRRSITTGVKPLA